MKALTGKVTIVTDASTGIGAGIATALGTQGASVIVSYASSREGADRVLGKIADAGGNAIAVQASVSEPSDVQRLFAETKKAFGKLDVLVNNAGVFKFEPFEAITVSEFHREFSITDRHKLHTRAKFIGCGNGNQSIPTFACGFGQRTQAGVDLFDSSDHTQNT